MSRSGQAAVIIPPNIGIKELEYKGKRYLIVKGYYKTMSFLIPDNFYLYKNGNYLIIVPTKGKNELTHSDISFWGYYRAYLETVFDFMELGYLVVLELNGVGFRLKLEGNVLRFFLGFSHIKEYPIPKDIFVKIGNKKETELHLFGYDKQYLCQVAAQIKLLKKPDMYKGKGIFFFNEELTLKQGKQMDS